MWLPAHLKLHMWLTLYFCWTVLLWALGFYSGGQFRCYHASSLAFPFWRDQSLSNLVGFWLGLLPNLQYLWCSHLCCLPVCQEDPDSRNPGLSSRILHLGNLTSQPPPGSHCVFFIRHSHKTIVNLKLNYTTILLSPACLIYPKCSELWR